MKNKALVKKELLFCLDLWQKQGYCAFGKETKCEQCACPYLLYKLLTEKVVHEKRMTLEEWQKLINELP